MHEANILSISEADISHFSDRYRANLINCLSGYKSANLVGSKSPDGHENLAIVNSVFHIGANPPLMGMIMRPHTVPRDTLQNIKTTERFTLNNVPQSIIANAHQTSARYPADISEFNECGLTPVYQDDFAAPFVAESSLQIALELAEIKYLAINKTEMVIAHVKHIYAPQAALSNDGYLDHACLQSTAVNGLDGYYQGQKVARYAYAKAGVKPSKLAP